MMMGNGKNNIRVLEAVAAFVAGEELVREAHVAAHAANSLLIHHCLKLEQLEDTQNMKEKPNTRQITPKERELQRERERDGQTYKEEWS